MANSVYAHLVYGFVVLNSEGFDFAEVHPPQWLVKNPEGGNGSMYTIEDIVARLENIQPPPEEYGDGSNSQITQKFKAYWQAMREAEKRSGVVLIEHCRAEHPMWILGVDASYQSEHRGGVNHLGQKIEAQSAWREILKNFCDRADIPFSEPEWLLAPFSE